MAEHEQEHETPTTRERRGASTTFVVAVRYDTPPVEGLAPETWCVVEAHADERRALDGARLISGFVESGGGAVIVVAEREEAPPRLVETYGEAPIGDGIAALARTPASVRAAFATAMSEYWTAVITSRPKERRTAPKARRRPAVLGKPALLGGIAAAVLVVATVVALRLAAPPEPTATATALDDAAIAFERSGGFVMMRPSPTGETTWAGEALYRTYRVHPDGRREFVGMRLADGSEPTAPPPRPSGGGGGGSGFGGGAPSGGGLNHLRTISESFR
ncbi:hypothetical protein [Salinarimonas rosea]|uniref:hypothetical protein n=1 Tax=Salinarimonas rosea TaxID=552063 RepID=UPI000424AE71|nr:hypothetical protein [Salinarimonas rosea]